VALSRPKDTRRPPHAASVNNSRRDFLIRFCQSASGILIPSGWDRLLPVFNFDRNTEAAPRDFHLHPHYRGRMPLDDVLFKVEAGSDEFVTEKYVDNIAKVLTRWTSCLLESPANLSAIKESILPDFSGSSFKPVGLRPLRTDPSIEVHQYSFSPQLSLAKDAFLKQLSSAWGEYTQIMTAEFQITDIDGSDIDESIGSGQLSTRVRYEIVAAGNSFYREQLIGSWDLLWQSSSGLEFQLLRWKALVETRSRAKAPSFLDITEAIIGDNACYSAQLIHGSDYWRTLLDGACGIEIYGNNGVAVGDIDGDGLDDLYVCQPAGLPNRLFRNRGDGTFEDVTEAAGVGIIENTSCALIIDVDNDGHQDLVVVRSHGPLLFLNDGTGKFRQKPDAFQFATPPQGTFTGAAAADYDRDGWLDIYFCLYVYYQGADQYKYPSPYHDAQNGPPNFMMRNNGDGTFRDVTAETRLSQNNTRYSFCCAWNDFDHDGWPDLYVVNDFGRKNLYRNNRDGTFTDVAPEVGVDDVGAGMGVCWFDYDNDGAEDLYVADMWTSAGERITRQEAFKRNSTPDIRALYHKHAMGNSLFHDSTQTRQGDSQRKPFEDCTTSAGVGIGRWAWASDSFDFDHDGFEDLYVVNGMISGPSRNDLNSFFWRQVIARSPDEARPSPDYELGWGAINELIRTDGTWSGYERNVFYANNRDGTFSDISGIVGLDFVEDGRAFALADFDMDGRQEIFLKNRNAPQLRVLKNVTANLPPSIAFRLLGKKSNRDAIGAVVTVKTERGLQARSVTAGSAFLSQHSKDLYFGLGSISGPITVSIRWPSGIDQELYNLPLNHRIWVEEGAAPSRFDPFRPTTDLDRFARLGPQPTETLPDASETWLLPPIAAPDFSLRDPRTNRTHSISALRGKLVLLHFCTTEDDRTQQDWTVFSERYAGWIANGLHLISVVFNEVGKNQVVSAGNNDFPFPVLSGSEDIAGIYNILLHYMFDRRRDISLPTCFLIDPRGEIVKLYQGPLDFKHLVHDYRNIPLNDKDRLSNALPFPGISEANGFRRNYLSYGAVYFQRGYIDQAEASFKLALRDDPQSAEALYGIGSVYLSQRRTAEARDCFQRVLKMHATYPDTPANTWNNLGMLAGNEGSTDEAMHDFEEALRLSPGHRPALNNLATTYRLQRRWTEALETYKRSLHLGPDDPEANYGIGMVYAQNDDTDHALQFLQRALKARPIYPEAMNNLGILYLRTDRIGEAVRIFLEAIHVAPKFDQPYLNLSHVYADENSLAKARSILRDLLKQYPDHPIALRMLEQLNR